MKKNLIIRFATPKDLETIVGLCREHAEFEKAKYSVKGKAEKLQNALFSPSPKFFCLLVVLNNEKVGFATYMKQFSTWEAQDYVYLDCLFLIEMARNMGIGEILINRIKQESKKLNCNLIQWQTPKFNKRAINFYKRIGAISKSKAVSYTHLTLPTTPYV